MADYRLYIDESGDHTYKQTQNLSRRYLGLTGILLKTADYTSIHDSLETLKREHFRFDPDNQLVLVRRLIVGREGRFGVLSDPARNTAWETGVLNFLSKVNIYPYTVVIDKFEHKKKYPHDTFNPYDYALRTLLRRVRSYLWNFAGHATCEVIAEARGHVEDNELRAAYATLYAIGDHWFPPDEFQQAYPDPVIGVRKKDENITGHQIADMLAAPQKELTIVEAGRPLFRPPSQFAYDMNAALGVRANKKYGRYMLT